MSPGSVSKPAMYEVTLAHRAPRGARGAGRRAAGGGPGAGTPTPPAESEEIPAVLYLENDTYSLYLLFKYLSKFLLFILDLKFSFWAK